MKSHTCNVIIIKSSSCLLTRSQNIRTLFFVGCMHTYMIKEHKRAQGLDVKTKYITRQFSIVGFRTLLIVVRASCVHMCTCLELCMHGCKPLIYHLYEIFCQLHWVKYLIWQIVPVKVVNKVINLETRQYMSPICAMCT